MKRFVLTLCLSLGLFTLSGCSGTTTRTVEAPLETEGTTTPPPGCVDLRERGGAC